MCEPVPRSHVVAILLAALMVASSAAGAQPGSSGARSSLVALASSRFPNLTRCERAILEYADLNTMSPAEYAVCGSSTKLDDPSNNPANGASWDHQRDVRAELFRWIFVDPDVIRQVDPGGVAMLGARIVGAIHLENVRTPFGLSLVRSAIPEVIGLEGSDIGWFAAPGSSVGGIEAGGSHMRGGVFLNGVKASARVFFGNSRIDNDFNCAGGSFVHNKQVSAEPWDAEKPALFLGAATIQGPIWLTEGFKADGAVFINDVTCIGVFCFDGRFINPGRAALFAWGANVSGGVVLGNSGQWSAMEADGLVQLDNAKVGGVVLVSGAKFLGKATEPHGLSAGALSAGGAFVWQKVTLQDGATLDLRRASVNGLIDDEGSWPLPGRLAIDGFSYGDFYGGPSDWRSRVSPATISRVGQGTARTGRPSRGDASAYRGRRPALRSVRSGWPSMGWISQVYDRLRS